MLTPARVSFNFTERCNMACKFCYIPWDSAEVTRERALDVVAKIAIWQPAWVTFGGGDPLLVDWFEELLETIKELSPRTRVHLDTNGIRLTPARLQSVAKHLDLLGLPIDGVGRELSFRMRHHPTHSQNVIETLKAAVKEVPLVKVNTVVSRINAEHLEEIGEVVAGSGAGIWSLYEFWPLGRDGLQNAETFRIDHQEYEDVVARAKARFPKLKFPRLVIEGGGSIEERRNTYFFVTPTGRAYTIAGNNSRKYAELGNLLTQNPGHVLRRWLKQASPSANEQRIEVRERELARQFRRLGLPDITTLFV